MTTADPFMSTWLADVERVAARLNQWASDGCPGGGVEVDDHTRAINDQAREVPDWMQIKAEYGEDF